jgi:hypothetical protein
VRYCGHFYGLDEIGNSVPGAVSAERLIEIVRSLPEGCTELACHPGDASELKTMYRDERLAELAALCDPRVLAAIRESGIERCSFEDLKGRT